MYDTWQVEGRQIRSIQVTFSSTTAMRTNGPRLENSAVPGLSTPCLWCQSNQRSKMNVLWIRIASSKLSVLKGLSIYYVSSYNKTGSVGMLTNAYLREQGFIQKLMSYENPH